DKKSGSKDEKSFADVVENADLVDGLFNLYTDKEDGTVYLAVKKKQLDQEYIHFGYVLDGVPALGLFRGRFLAERIFTVRKRYQTLEFVVKNTAFYFDPENALSKAAEANISDATIASIKIEATTEDKTTYLIKADSLFLTESFAQIKSHSDPKKEQLVLGDLSDKLTRFAEVKNYPENTLFRVDYTYTNKQPKKWGDDDVTDARYITAKVQHALIAVPDNDYQPRYEDPRVGYFTSRLSDLTSAKSANYMDMINRWHLKKKNPAAEKSDPIEPITWWMENTTPHELRDTVKGAVEAWNLAFESAGFTNAIVCKQQPDDADWDAGDIRYNVLRWTSSPDPPFGGYGPSFANPRTGQLLGSDIMLEYIFLTNRIRLRELLQRTDPVKADPNQFPFNRMDRGRFDSRAFCQAGNFRQDDLIASRAILSAAGASEIDMDELLKEALYELVLHEIGHTLGLNHNFLASYLHTPEQLHDKKRTEKMGLISSVMDYSPTNIARDRKKQGQYYSTVPGPYDHWAIRFGYAEVDAPGLAEILAESTKPEHAFGNDADDMRSSGKGIDPRIMINDISSDPIAAAIASIERVRETVPTLAAKFPKEGETYHELRVAFSSLMRTYSRNATVLTRHIGGVYVDRSVHGQEGAPATPLTPVAADDQKRAIGAIEKYVFAKGAFDFIPSELLAHLQLQRRGFDFFDLDANEDPKLHNTIHFMQDYVLDQLLHKNTLQRMVDSALYGNEVGIDQHFESLQSAIITGETDTFREAAQLDYIKRLIQISGLKDSSSYIPQAQSQAVWALIKTQETLEGQPASAHQQHLLLLIKKALDSD
ncbi:MAG: zinc-dependent metalloprotease, partial [Verrucomicrobiota bacterium]